VTFCTPASTCVVEGLGGSCSKNANTLTEGGGSSVGLEPVDCLRAMATGAACSLFWLRLALTLSVCPERETDSCVIVQPLPVEAAEDAAMPEKRETRDDEAVFLALDRRPLRSGCAAWEELNMLGLVTRQMKTKSSWACWLEA
jgi:hypothetical protein